MLCWAIYACYSSYVGGRALVADSQCQTERVLGLEVHEMVDMADSVQLWTVPVLCTQKLVNGGQEEHQIELLTYN